VALFTFKGVLDTKRMDGCTIPRSLGHMVGGCETLRFTRDGELLVPRRPVLSSMQNSGVSYFEIL
jgi:hypothetical protein